MDAATRTELTADLAAAVTAYQQHRDNAIALLASADSPCDCADRPARDDGICYCDHDPDDCQCGDVTDPDADRAAAAVHAQLAVAASGIAQAMAALLANN